MKNLMYLAVAAMVMVSCKEESKDYVALSGKISNQNSDSLVVYSNADRDFEKRISVNADGSFSDTLKVVSGDFRIMDGTEGTSLYLKNGYDLKLTLDTKEFDETVAYSGIGAEPNNYLAKDALMQESAFSDEAAFDLDEEAFAAKLTAYENEMLKGLEGKINMDSTFIAGQKDKLVRMKKFFMEYHKEKQFLKTVLGKGVVSPEFVDYENNAGGTTSLDDLKGAYVYIDVWATWCGPCKAEIPFLKEVEEAYHGKNIKFVSLSIDEQKNHDKWKAMIKEKELGGIQLLSDKDWESDFVQNYKINGIPRFILLDPEGNIVSSDAPRPSNDKLKDLFNELNI